MATAVSCRTKTLTESVPPFIVCRWNAAGTREKPYTTEIPAKPVVTLRGHRLTLLLDPLRHAAVILARARPLHRIPVGAVSTLRGRVLVIAGNVAGDRAPDILAVFTGRLHRALSVVPHRASGLLRLFPRLVRDIFGVVRHSL